MVDRGAGAAGRTLGRALASDGGSLGPLERFGGEGAGGEIAAGEGSCGRGSEVDSWAGGGQGWAHSAGGGGGMPARAMVGPEGWASLDPALLAHVVSA